MSPILSILVWTFIGAGTAYLAFQRGRDPYIWFAIGIFLGVFGILILLILPPLNAKEVTTDPNATIIEVPAIIDPFATKDWFYLDREGKQQGPIDIGALRNLWMTNGMDSKTFVWSEGMDKWKRVEEVPGLVERLKI